MQTEIKICIVCGNTFTSEGGEICSSDCAEIDLPFRVCNIK